MAVEVLPGASALPSALVASGFTAHNHYFGGFLPRKVWLLKQRLQELAELSNTVLVFYESVHRVAKTLAQIAEVFPNREVAIVRELTKLHEEVLSDNSVALAQQIQQRLTNGSKLRGELVLLVGKRPAD